MTTSVCGESDLNIYTKFAVVMNLAGRIKILIRICNTHLLNVRERVLAAKFLFLHFLFSIFFINRPVRLQYDYWQQSNFCKCTRV